MTSFGYSVIGHVKKWSAPGLLLLAVFRVKNKNLLVKRWGTNCGGESMRLYVSYQCT